ncbi:MAG: DUF58 domain-containing protein [Actinomycetaceae bacterium]|nr:DUF58 domain-containing protein [Actinomycetaceae bacterium]
MSSAVFGRTDARSGRRTASQAWADAVAGLRQRRAEAAERLAKIPVLGRVIPVLRVVTAFGWTVLCLAGASWYFGLRGQWLELTGLALLLSFVLVAAIAWTIGSVRYRVDLNVASRRLVVGESAVGELAVTNVSARACPSSLVELPVGATLAQFAVPPLAAKASFGEVFTVPTIRRGVITVGPARSVRGDGLGLLRREQRWVEPQDLYIHPRTVAVGSSSVGFIRDIEGATTHDLSSSDVAFHALREYLPGDDRRNVHWKTTARTGKLMVRQFEETRRAHLLLVFDDDIGSWASSEEYEMGVSVAASIGVAVMRERRELSFASQLGPVATASARAFLDAMTVLEPRPRLAGLRDLARAASDRQPSASVVAIVTGSLPAISQIHAAHTVLPVGAWSFALRCQAGQRLGRKMVAGLPVVTIPELESLPLALRKAVG